MAHVLNSVAVHFKSAEQIVIDYVRRRLLIVLNRNDGFLIDVPLCHSLYISIVSRNHICLSKSVISAMFF